MFVLKLSEGVLPLQTPHTGPLMTSCWKSMRDSCSWLLRWPQTRNLSFHSSDREICSVALKRSPVDRELASCHVAGVLLPPVSVPPVSQPEAALFLFAVFIFIYCGILLSHTFFLLTVVVSHTALSLLLRKKKPESNQSFNHAVEHGVIWYTVYNHLSLVI